MLEPSGALRPGAQQSRVVLARLPGAGGEQTKRRLADPPSRGTRCRESPGRLPASGQSTIAGSPQSAVAQIAAQIGRDRPGDRQRDIDSPRRDAQYWHECRHCCRAGRCCAIFSWDEIVEDRRNPHPEAARELADVRTGRHGRHGDLRHKQPLAGKVCPVAGRGGGWRRAAPSLQDAPLRSASSGVRQPAASSHFTGTTSMPSSTERAPQRARNSLDSAC